MLYDTDNDPRTGGHGFAVCDEANGWYMPETAPGSGTVDTSWEGHCIPACYKSGYQGPNSATGALLVSNLEDECWHTTDDLAYADYDPTDETVANAILSKTDEMAVYGCGLDSTGATGFCECIGDWAPYETAGYEG